MLTFIFVLMSVYAGGASLASLRLARAAPVCIVEFNVHIHVRVHVCVRGRGALFVSHRSLGVPVHWSSMFTFMFVFISVQRGAGIVEIMSTFMVVFMSV